MLAEPPPAGEAAERRMGKRRFGHLGRGLGENIYDSRALGLGSNGNGTGEQEVSYQDRGWVSPNQISYRVAPANLSVVHHVIVKQGGSV